MTKVKREGGYITSEPNDSQVSSTNKILCSSHNSLISFMWFGKPSTWTKINAAGSSSIIIRLKLSTSKPKLSLSQSHIIGSNPKCIAGVTVVTQDTAGTTILLFLSFFDNISEYIAARLAEEPELTNTEYLQPNHSDHFLSNSTVNSPFVSRGLVLNQEDRFSISFLSIVSLTRCIFSYVIVC